MVHSLSFVLALIRFFSFSVSISLVTAATDITAAEGVSTAAAANRCAQFSRGFFFYSYLSHTTFLSLFLSTQNSGDSPLWKMSLCAGWKIAAGGDSRQSGCCAVW